jgi:hypothetical protein
VLNDGHRSEDGEEQRALDLTSSVQDRDQEIEQLLTPGAREDIGQAGAESRTMLTPREK